jgi:hypothetical protein
VIKSVLDVLIRQGEGVRRKRPTVRERLQPLFARLAKTLLGMLFIA